MQGGPSRMTWTQRDAVTEVAEIAGGRLFLRLEHRIATLTYQSDRPAGSTEADIRRDRERRNVPDRRYWELGAIAPGESMACGGFKSKSLAKILLAEAQDQETILPGGRYLEASGYHIAGTDEYGGVRWVRKTGPRRDVVVTNAHRVYALLEMGGRSTPTVIFDLALDNRVVARGAGEKPVTVHYIWPAFMDTIDALTVMAARALQRARP